MFYPLNYKGLCSLSSLRSSVARLPWGNRNIGRMPFCECPLSHCATDRFAFVRLSNGKTKRAARRFSIPHTTPATELSGRYIEKGRSVRAVFRAAAKITLSGRADRMSRPPSTGERKTFPKA